MDSPGDRANNTVDIEIDTRKDDRVVGPICSIHLGPEAAARTWGIVKTPRTRPHNSPTPQQLLSLSFSDGPAWDDHLSIWGLVEVAEAKRTWRKSKAPNRNSTT